MKRTMQFLALITALAGAPGCAALLGGADMEAVATSVQKPANVAVYLKVTESDEPVGDLELKNFEISENDQVLSAEEVGLRLLPRDPLTNERVVLLVDISGKPSPELKRSLASAVEGFVEKVRSQVPVSVLAYDGSPGLKAVGEYPRVPEGSAAPDAKVFETLAATDESRDLYGALIKGVKELDVRMMQQKKPVHLGTLVVFARGPDLAGRSDEYQVQQALEHKNYEVVGIGIGAETPYLDSLAKAGVIRAHTPDTLPIAFEDAAMRVLLQRGKYYVLAYCSPARSGTRTLRVDLRYVGKDNGERHAKYYFDFDAQGFGPGCNSETPPRFVVPRPENEAAPVAPAPSEPIPTPEQATGGDPAAAPPTEAAPPAEQ